MTLKLEIPGVMAIGLILICFGWRLIGGKET